MLARLLSLGLVLLVAACSSAEDGPDDPDGPALPGIRATVQSSGRALPESVGVLVCVDSSDAVCQSQSVSANGEVTFSSLEPGDYYVRLENLAENCSLLGEWLLPVALQDSTVTVGFELQCRGPGTVRVSAVTSGPNQPAVYGVRRDTSCDVYYDYRCEGSPLTSSGSVDFTSFPGPETFVLEGVTDNCAVIAPGNPATVTVVEDGIVELRFEVACQ